MPVSFLFAWVTISILYIASGIFIGSVWRDELPDSVWVTLLCAGGALFIAVNQRFIVSVSSLAVEAFLLVAALGVWVFVVTGIVGVVAERRRLVPSEGP